MLRGDPGDDGAHRRSRAGHPAAAAAAASRRRGGHRHARVAHQRDGAPSVRTAVNQHSVTVTVCARHASSRTPTRSSGRRRRGYVLPPRGVGNRRGLLAALQQSGHTTAIVGVLATAAFGLRAFATAATTGDPGATATRTKVLEQAKVADGACASSPRSVTGRRPRPWRSSTRAGSTTWCSWRRRSCPRDWRPRGRQRQSGASRDGMRGGFHGHGHLPDRRHKSELLKGDGATCDLLLEGCVKMLSLAPRAASFPRH